ncbi:hypothetical protein PUN28_013726 [Cardiocondyla obscurior]|uniref:Uncharacterized protein n=1 Tax=Cardiocondyla obscurior TaxID=286306 RepID=A0AAW2F420_9HYME
MNSCSLLLLLGYLCLCIAINPIESSDWDVTFPEISESYNKDFDNCTQCDLNQDTGCRCYAYIDSCLVCCPDLSSCCICKTCEQCWNEQRQLVIMTQIIISVLFGFGIIGLIIVYCKVCNRARHHTRRRRIVLHEEHACDLTTQCSTVESLRDRPPSYNEIVRNAPPVYTSFRDNAPPLYTSPYNRTSMQESPPSYPGTPKLQDKLEDSNNSLSSPTVAQHM